MSFYDDASIVMIPSGYKASKLYCAKPTDGSGDLAFTRTGSTATRVNSSGLIERCITNLLLNSATLSTQNVTVVAAPYTLSFFGTGSVTLSGTGTGTLAGTGAGNRVSLTFTPTAGTLTLTVSGSVTSAQLEIGDNATAYIPTTSAAVTVGPVANLPRLDYTGGGCPKLLMEPTRTNNILYSQMFSDTSWTKTNATVSGNVEISPDGYRNADLLLADTTNALHNVNRANLTSVSGTTYVASVFVKYGGYDYVNIQTSNATTANLTFRFSTEEATLSGVRAVVGSEKVEKFNNGWYRLSYATVSIVSATFTHIINIRNDSNQSTFIGDGTKGVYAYGYQYEVGSYATSYIPTFNASVTRNQDEFIKSSITSLLGQTEGTLFFDFVFGNQYSANEYLGLSDNTISNRVIIGLSATNTITSIVSSGGSDVATISKTDAVVGQRYKCAIAYKLNDFVFYINGVQIGTDTSGAVPTSLTQIINSSGLTSNRFFENINQFIVFKTRLLNSDLATLTTI